MPRTLSTDEFKELGKRYYVKQDYQRALDAFTEGIQTSSGSDIQLYDYRAATYDKVDNSTAALADSRRMIKADERDPRGYLRAGQLLVKIDKTSQALQIYERGLRYVPVANQLYNLLRGAHDKLNRELHPATAVDPLTQLPIEIVELIFSHLEFHKQVVCTRVSKQWRGFLFSNPRFWTRLDLFRPGSKRTVKASFVKTCVKASQSQIRYARLANFHHTGVLNHMVTVCKSLDTIEFANCDFGFDSFMRTIRMARQLKRLTIRNCGPLSIPQLAHILRHGSLLESVCVSQVLAVCVDDVNGALLSAELPCLRVLDLQGMQMSTSRGLAEHFFRELFKLATELRELSLVHVPTNRSFELFDVTSLTKLEVLRLHHIVIVDVHLPLTLKVFDYHGLQFTSLSSLNEKSNGLPLLEQLHLVAYDAIPETVLDRLNHKTRNEETVFSSPPSLLKRLTLNVLNFPIGTPNLGQILEHPRLKDIQDVYFAGEVAVLVDDDLLGQIPYILSNLKKLKLHSASCTGAGIKDLVVGLKNTLQELELIACDSVSHDTLKWVARQGVRVHVSQNR